MFSLMNPMGNDFAWSTLIGSKNFQRASMKNILFSFIKPYAFFLNTLFEIMSIVHFLIINK